MAMDRSIFYSGGHLRILFWAWFTRGLYGVGHLDHLAVQELPGSPLAKTRRREWRLRHVGSQ